MCLLLYQGCLGPYKISYFVTLAFLYKICPFSESLGNSKGILSNTASVKKVAKSSYHSLTK